MTENKKSPAPNSSVIDAVEQGKVLTIDLELILTPLSVIIAGIIIATAIIIGSWRIAGSGGLSSSSDTVTNTNTATNTNTGNVADSDPTSPAKTTIDDDPYIGDKDKAKIAIVEFSDYECPFCKKYWSQTYSQIKENYVNTGKAIYVFRDFPLSIHEPMATKESLAAECVKDMANNEKYFEFHDKIFENTTSNGNGLNDEQLLGFAEEMGLDRAAFNECYTSQRFAEEVKKDLADGSNAGITGTPSFVIGKLDDKGNVDGVVIAGAYPYSDLQAIIEKQLNK